LHRGGFGVVSSEDDPGWYGKGIYTTSHMKYAGRYAESKAGTTKKPALLICVIIPGYILPVVDTKTYYGKPVANGYKSHFTIGKRPIKGLTRIDFPQLLFFFLLS